MKIVFNKEDGCYQGFPNYGPGSPNEVASEALVFMLVGLHTYWKYPVGYVLCDKINADNLYCLIAQALTLANALDYEVFIRLLHEEQIDKGLKFGNKLSSCHINYHRHKMNVSIAAQTISSSVADAIGFLRDTLHPSFANSLASIRFIRITDCLFDLLNSRNPLGTGFKRPLRLVDKPMWSKTIDGSVEYLSSLRE